MICEKTVKQFCNEDISLIENYQEAINDTKQTWHCHHRLEIELNKSENELTNMNLYYNRPASELIFLTSLEHKSMHMSITFKNRQKTRDQILKISKSKLGTPAWNKGKTNIYSEETRKKMGGGKREKLKWLTQNGEIKYMNIRIPIEKYSLNKQGVKEINKLIKK